MGRGGRGAVVRVRGREEGSTGGVNRWLAWWWPDSEGMGSIYLGIVGILALWHSGTLDHLTSLA